jgi:hypothetical protein
MVSNHSRILRLPGKSAFQQLRAVSNADPMSEEQIVLGESEAVDRRQAKASLKVMV